MSEEKEYQEWKQTRVKNLTTDDGWLTLCGLWWLDEENKVYNLGSGSSNDIKFPEGKTPEVCGSLMVISGKVYLETKEEYGLEIKGEKIKGKVELQHDSDGEITPTFVQIRSIMFFVVKRGDQLGLRAKDKTHPSLLHFKGIESYPFDLNWRLEADFEPYNPPKQLPVMNVFGKSAPQTSPGRLVFTVKGETHSLEAIAEKGSEKLFIIFKDLTNGVETYGMRYLYTKLPDANNKVIVDFNRSFNPPCAFTEFATCPVPHKENRLKIAIPVGEKLYGDHH